MHIVLPNETSQPKKAIICMIPTIVIRKRQNYRDSEKISGFQELGKKEEEMNRWSTGNFLGL